ncbi:alpha-hydroxy-acid oxidizing protein [Streptomyces sp. NPDC017405]|uniref:alpha-hydroxy acid oxidase n=1 Tax=unclassified Streptomyces TaxID=2593676 RepID=UPI0037A5457B
MTPDPVLGGPIGTLTAAAQEKLPAEIFHYAAGGAGDEATVLRNVRNLDAFRLVPRVMRDVSAVDTSAEVVGGSLAAPLLVAPMGMQRLYHEGAEVTTARAAAELGTGFCLSMFGSCSPEQVAGAAPGQVRWRQMYLTKDRRLNEELIRQAEDAGFDAVVCTVDLPVMAERFRDAGNTFQTFDNEVAEAWSPALVREPYFKEPLGLWREERPEATPQQFIDHVFPHPGCGWDDLERLVGRSPLPVIVKGVLHPDDAVRAVGAGAAAVVVSNHGGSQHDRSVAAVDALPAVAGAVDGAVPVYFDSGVRSGTHAAVALALGADAVLVGRPVLWGLAVHGPDGVRAVLEHLTKGLRDSMAFVGARTVRDLRKATVLCEPGPSGAVGRRDGHWPAEPSAR